MPCRLNRAAMKLLMTPSSTFAPPPICFSTPWPGLLDVFLEARPRLLGIEFLAAGARARRLVAGRHVDFATSVHMVGSSQSK